MKNILKIFLFGLLIWIIMFIIGTIFWPLSTSQNSLFKSLMIIFGTLTGMIFIILYFKKMEENFLINGFLCGIIWLILNIILDLIVLVAMLKTNIYVYFIETGIRYLSIFFICSGCGLLLNIKKKS